MKNTRKFKKRTPPPAPNLELKRTLTPFQSTVDYKNINLLIKYISNEGKILPRRITGLTSKQQRAIAKAIKNARMVGLLPFINLD
uniref:Small ribosomal subunit protein bS18c n=1 Tax=Neodangemannia microcystis TaxID=173495 RepID=A0A1W6EHA4_9CHLO|nr:ribosomal protein S18 [Neodangemannia microcystis]ARK14788.1 ribosomal protein S18 [Neodangemannia microcystis]